MTVHVTVPPGLDAVERVDRWFRSLQAQRPMRMSEDELSALDLVGTGWRLRIQGRPIALVVDVEFPYSLPVIYLEGYSSERPLPHVEATGKLCLHNPVIPSDPEGMVSAALADAGSLLRAVTSGAEDDDFHDDFSRYWNDAADSWHVRTYRLCDTARADAYLAYTAIGNNLYVFDTKADGRRWLSNFIGTPPSTFRQGVRVALTTLPAPDRYPRTGAELWRLIVARSEAGGDALLAAMRQSPKSLVVLLTGRSPRRVAHAAAILLKRKLDGRGQPIHRRALFQGYVSLGEVPGEVLCDHYQVLRLPTYRLDAASTRLPFDDIEVLWNTRVCVVGCGALGSSVAMTLAKSGVGNLTLIDDATLEWENVRRHELGARNVGRRKAAALANLIQSNLPDVRSCRVIEAEIQSVLRTEPDSITRQDLVVSCTGAWEADMALNNFLATSSAGPAAIFGWLEGHALAAHAVLLDASAQPFSKGFDPAGSFRMQATTSTREVPPECGADTSPFGAVELGHAGLLVSRLAIDALRKRKAAPTWRTWLTDAVALADASGSWTSEWVARHGMPPSLGGVVEGEWIFDGG